MDLTSIRINTLHRTFGDVCREAYESYLELSEQIASIAHTSDIENQERDQLEYKQFNAGLKSIVFAGMCFEASIYDYAARNLGDNYVVAHMDKMDLVSKWIVIPRLVCQKELQKDKVPFASFKQLVKARNSLVHHKSRPLGSITSENLDKLKQQEEGFSRDVINSFRAIIFMSLEMDLLVGLDNPLPMFGGSVITSVKYSARIDTVIDDCKSVLKKSME